MKKLFVMAAAIIALASCGNKTAQNNGTVADSTEYNPVETLNATQAEATTSAVADSVTKILGEQLTAKDAKKVQSTINAVMAKYQELVKAGKTEEAALYASQVKSFVNEHAEEIKTIASGNATIADVVNGIANLPTNAKQAAEAAANAVNSDANAAANAATTAAKNAESNAKKAVSNAKKQTEENLKNAKKAAEADAKAKVDNAKQQTRDAANKAVNNALNKVLGQ